MQRVGFGSKIGIILATAGSAVGLGNIWRFPTMAGQDGGSAFIILYLVITQDLTLSLKQSHVPSCDLCRQQYMR